MSKRFIDTELWKNDWFMEMTPAEKLAWVYVTTQCDNVGVWKPNFRLAEFVIGTQLDWEKFARKTAGNVEIFDNGKWFLPDFCDFQYGELVETNNAHRSYIRQLKRHGIEGLVRGCQAPQEKEKEKEKEQEEEKDARKRGVHPTLNVPMGETRYANLCKEWGASVVDRYIQKVIDWTNAKDEVTKDYAARAATFITRDAEAGKLTKPLRDDGPMTFAEARAMDE